MKYLKQNPFTIYLFLSIYFIPINTEFFFFSALQSRDAYIPFADLVLLGNKLDTSTFITYSFFHKTYFHLYSNIFIGFILFTIIEKSEVLLTSEMIFVFLFTVALSGLGLSLYMIYGLESERFYIYGTSNGIAGTCTLFFLLSHKILVKYFVIPLIVVFSYLFPEYIDPKINVHIWGYVAGYICYFLFYYKSLTIPELRVYNKIFNPRILI